MTTRAVNPSSTSSGSLLDRSTAKPGNVDMAIFASKRGTATKEARLGEGTTSSDYLQRSREEDPWPPESSCAPPAKNAQGTAIRKAQSGTGSSIVLSDCRILTPLDKLALDQPFEMSVAAKSAAPLPSGNVVFRLLCSLPGTAPQDRGEDQSTTFPGKIADGIAKATGKLVSPKNPVPAGTKLQYRVVAEHPGTQETCESQPAEVEAGKPPKPLAVWTLGALHFGFDSSFILPSAASQIADFKAKIAQNPGAAVAVFGHADPVGDDAFNKKLSGRRAFAVYCLLAKEAPGWTQLAGGIDGDKWDLRTTQTILGFLKDAAGTPYYGGAVDGKDGPKTQASIKNFLMEKSPSQSSLTPMAKEALFRAYMDKICEVSCKREDFVGDPKDAKRQWACSGCGEFNPTLVFGKTDADKFRSATSKPERDIRNAPNRRATVMLFPPGAKGPGNVAFPCPSWTDGIEKCKKQFFADGDARRNPSDAQRTWQADKDTFACRFYAGISDEAIAPSGRHYIDIELIDEDGAILADTHYRLKLPNGSVLEGKSDSQGRISHPDNEHEGPVELTLLDSSPARSEHFIDIQLVDNDRHPLPDTAYQLVLPNGDVLEGRSDADGYIHHLDNGHQGIVKLILPQYASAQSDFPTNPDAAEST